MTSIEPTTSAFAGRRKDSSPAFTVPDRLATEASDRSTLVWAALVVRSRWPIWAPDRPIRPSPAFTVEREVFDRAGGQREPPRVAPGVEEVPALSPPASIDSARADASMIGVRPRRVAGLEPPAVARRRVDDEDTAPGGHGDPGRAIERALLGRHARRVRRRRRSPPQCAARGRTAAQQQAGDRRGEHARGQAEARPAEDDAQPDRDESERPQPEGIGDGR